MTETTSAVAWNDPRVVVLARDRCRLADGSSCEGPGNDCDGENCLVVKLAMKEITQTQA